MGPPGGGRTFITQRYLRHYNIIALTEFSGASLTRIFSTVLTFFLKPFDRSMQKLTEPLVATTLDLYNTVAKELLPTPTKSHYVFNLRDLSKVVQGIMQVKPATCADSDGLVKLWYHECSRVFRDRLVDKPDRFWFDKFMSEAVTSAFQKNWAAMVSGTVLYGHFMGGDPETAPYAQIEDASALQKLLEEGPSRANFTSRSVRRVLLMPQVNPGSPYRCGKRT